MRFSVVLPGYTLTRAPFLSPEPRRRRHRVWSRPARRERPHPTHGELATLPVPSIPGFTPWSTVPVIPVRAGHGAAVGTFFPGEPPPGFHPAPLDLARMVQISWYQFGPQRTVDSVHRGRVSAHVSAPTPAWCTTPNEQPPRVNESAARSAIGSNPSLPCTFCRKAPAFSRNQPAVQSSSN